MKIFLMLSFVIGINANAQEGFICEPTGAAALKLDIQNINNNAFTPKTTSNDKRLLKKTLSGWEIRFYTYERLGKPYACNGEPQDSKIIHCTFNNGGEFRFSHYTNRYIETFLGGYLASLEPSVASPQITVGKCMPI
jgi:hypothetical protein